MPILIYLGPSTRDNKKRLNYLKRHKVNEDWENPLTAGSLSRFILWGSSRNIDDNIKKYVRRFKIKDNRK